jgi:anti-sigma regulatory factor (Ser/Thr protein kinase)
MSDRPEELIRVPLPRAPDCGAVARRFVGKHLGPRLSTQHLTDAKLVASELANNAYVHGRGRIELRLRIVGGHARIEVVDEGHGAAVVINDNADLIGGRGLRIVDQVSLAWGAYEGTTHVWADLPLAG